MANVKLLREKELGQQSAMLSISFHDISKRNKSFLTVSIIKHQIG